MRLRGLRFAVKLLEPVEQLRELRWGLCHRAKRCASSYRIARYFTGVSRAAQGPGRATARLLGFRQALLERLVRNWCLIVALLLSSSALAQQAPTVFRGSWTATAGPSQVLRGTWAGQASAQNRNSAQGSWTLLGEAGQIVLEGTWSAQKTSHGWQGSWTARVQRGRSFSGTWTAIITDPGSKTFEDLLKQTLEKEIGGSWRSGSYKGNWWLKGSSPQGNNR